MVPTVGSSFSRIDSDKNRQDQSAKFGELGAQGYTINQIAYKMGLDASHIARYFQSVGRATKGSGGTEPHAIAMSGQGFHPSVIAVTLGVQEKYITSLLKNSRTESQRPSSSVSLVSNVASRVRKQSDGPSSEVTVRDPELVTAPEHEIKDDADEKASVPVLTLRELATQGKTAVEIAEALVSTPIRVLNEATKKSIYLYSSKEERANVEMILGLRTSGMPLEEVCKVTGIKMSAIKRIANSIIDREGPQHEVFKKLLDEGILVTSKAEREEVTALSKGSPSPDATNQKASMTGVFVVGQRVAIRSDLENVRPELEGRLGQSGVIISLLANVAALRPDTDTSHTVQALTSELKLLRLDDEWKVDEIVTWTTDDGSELVGRVAVGPYTSRDVIKYVVVFDSDDEDDMIVAGRLFDQ